MSTALSIVLHQREGSIATVVLNQPKKLNALSKAAWSELGGMMRALSEDESLRCVVLRGAGEEAFAAGADISEFITERANAEQAREYGARIHEAIRAISECRHPTIAMIYGACIGGGLEIASACDLRIAGESARFGIPINKLALTVGYGELQSLLATAGRSTTLELLLEGRIFGAREALTKGLLTRVVADDQLQSETATVALRIAAGAPLVARWHKRFIARLAAHSPLSEDEWNEGFACFDTEDYREGIRAFLEKRSPIFRGC